MPTVSIRRADTILIGFDADCKTRSQMIMNMNGKCRDGTTGRVDLSKPGSDEALERGRIDRKAVQWMDSAIAPSSLTQTQSALHTRYLGQTARVTPRSESTTGAPPHLWVGADLEL